MMKGGGELGGLGDRTGVPECPSEFLADPVYLRVRMVSFMSEMVCAMPTHLL